MAADAPAGEIPLDLTWAALNDTALTLNPMPQPGADPTDGAVVVISAVQVQASAPQAGDGSAAVRDIVSAPVETTAPTFDTAVPAPVDPRATNGIVGTPVNAAPPTSSFGGSPEPTDALAASQEVQFRPRGLVARIITALRESLLRFSARELEAEVQAPSPIHMGETIADAVRSIGAALPESRQPQSFGGEQREWVKAFLNDLGRNPQTPNPNLALKVTLAATIRR